MSNKDNNNYFIKNGVSLKEYEMHKHIYDLHIVNVPKIIAYNRETNTMVMEKINHMCVSDYYGEDADTIHDELFMKIKCIIKTLWENNIVYPDITGYNFIEYNNKVWIIDFEHSNFKPLVKNDDFVETFITNQNLKKWNPRFK
jgi:tRNA A-37 threonylcarbamoyl transferase component Bud32